jgi:hypothetical protein
VKPPKLHACRTADPADDRARTKGFALLGKILLAIACGLFVVVLFTFGLGEFVTDVAVVGRLLRSPPPVGAESGRVWGRALANVSGVDPFVTSAHVVCDAQSQYYVSGKGGGWREEARKSFQTGYPTVTLEDGRTLEIAGDRTRFEPYRGTPPTSELAALYRRRGPAFRGPRIYEQCLQRGEVFVDGCVNAGGDKIVPCSDQGYLTITQGKRRLRMVERVRSPAVALCLFGILWTGIVAILAQRMRGRSSEAGIGLAVGLAPRGLGGVRVADGKTKRKRWLRHLPAALVPLAFAVLCAVTACPAPLFWASVCLLPLALGALEPLHRLRTLRALLQAVVDRPTSALASAEGDVVELAVRVAPNAPIIAAPLTGRPAAHVSIQVWQRVVRQSGRSTKVVFEFVYAGNFFGDALPIEDETGGGTLDLGEAILDFHAQETIATSAEFADALRERTQMGGGDFLVRESILQPGEWLYVLGPVRRTLDATSEGSFAYRAAPTKARVSPHDDESDEERHPLFVHAGTEQTLLEAIKSGIARETTFSWMLGAAAVLVGGWLAMLTLVCLI